MTLEEKRKKKFFSCSKKFMIEVLDLIGKVSSFAGTVP
jgi:hypothetical protein